MGRRFVRKNINIISILLFCFVFILIQYFKPGFLYNRDGSLKRFGLGRKKKTVLPIWLVTFIIAIFSYLAILFYLTMHKF